MTARRNDERTTAGAHRMMRRADREVSDPAQVAAIVASCKIIRIAYMDAEGLTIVPMNCLRSHRKCDQTDILFPQCADWT